MSAHTVSDAIADACDKRGWEYYPGYSGRGMYGRRTPAIVCHPRYVSSAVAVIARLTGCRKSEVSVDNMALDMVVYNSSYEEDNNSAAQTD